MRVKEPNERHENEAKIKKDETRDGKYLQKRCFKAIGG